MRGRGMAALTNPAGPPQPSTTAAPVAARRARSRRYGRYRGSRRPRRANFFVSDVFSCPHRRYLRGQAPHETSILRHSGYTAVSLLQSTRDGVLRWVWLRRLHRGERTPLRPPTCAQHGPCMLPTTCKLLLYVAHLEGAKPLL